MGCCDKITSIISGNVNYLANELLTIAGLPREHYAYADERLKICKDCEHRGFVSLNEYVVWGIENREALIEHFDDLTKVGDFPARKEPYGSSEHQVCTMCKCFILKKVFSERENCPLEKWKGFGPDPAAF